MQKLVIEIDGNEAADIDAAASQFIDEMTASNCEVRPEHAKGVRDGGALLLSIAVLGGAASVAQIATTIHTLSRKKNVQIIVVSHDGQRLPISEVEAPADLIKVIESAVAK